MTFLSKHNNLLPLKINNGLLTNFFILGVVILMKLTKHQAQGHAPNILFLEAPMKFDLKLVTNEDVEEVDWGSYQRLMGKLVYPSHTCPDIAFVVDIDFDKEPIGTGKDGRSVYFKDIGHLLKKLQSVLRDMFKSTCEAITKGNPMWNQLPVPSSTMYSWDPNSTYIHEPPYFKNMTMEPPGAHGVKDAYCLLNFGDSITTYHISPAGSIHNDRPAAKYLLDRGVDRKDFNSYGSRHGNDEVMRYKDSGYDSIVLAGAEEVVAPEIGLQKGIKALIAKSFERIHRSNLVGMGIIPLCFKSGEDADTLGLTGQERYTIGLPSKITDIRPGQDVTVTTDNGKSFTCTVLFDTEESNDLDSSEVPITVEEAVEIHVENAGTSKTRGCTTLKELYQLPPGHRVKVSRNDVGQPMGLEARFLSGYLGIVGRTANLLPINYKSWREMPNSNKNQALDFVKDREHVGVASRQQQKFKHTAGSKSFDCIANDEENTSGSKVSRIKLFDMTHTKKDGTPMIAEVAAIMQKLREKRAEYEATASSHGLVNVDDIENQAINGVLSLERYGWVHCQG
ncbi:hypothetical protein F3Y22_tig00110864pilonHSYRG00202 [Hibiscus syriacus]|uniref:Aconitase A/isopropylmalate dehydratase small subunit swivel domain-containing protein n=1 Tax=Hibiscus syriacus TaxID=106335 RepID=A0A6A2ZLC6_HIBSY|nr:hypothetical protein F3Y22_tig00110864pilonHSYRG00202 [Hibiscus syriacus]